MVLAVVLVCHFSMSMAVFSIPYMTRREMLFGVVLPADCRRRPEGRRAIRAFQMTVVLSAVAGVLIHRSVEFALDCSARSWFRLHDGFSVYRVCPAKPQAEGVCHSASASPGT